MRFVKFLKASMTGAAEQPFDQPITFRLHFDVTNDGDRTVVDGEDTFEAKCIWAPIWDTNIDQVLDELEFGPLTTEGETVIELECEPPDVTRIPDPTGPTAFLVDIRRKGKPFVHVGFNMAIDNKTEEIPEVYTSGKLLTRRVGKCCHRSYTSRDASPTRTDDGGAKVVTPPVSKKHRTEVTTASTIAT